MVSFAELSSPLNGLPVVMPHPQLSSCSSFVSLCSSANPQINAEMWVITENRLNAVHTSDLVLMRLIDVDGWSTRVVLLMFVPNPRDHVQDPHLARIDFGCLKDVVRSFEFDPLSYVLFKQVLVLFLLYSSRSGRTLYRAKPHWAIHLPFPTRNLILLRLLYGEQIPNLPSTHLLTPH
jgi:hypothetical protein